MTTSIQSLSGAIDKAQPGVFQSALAKVLLGTILTPNKRTITANAPGLSINLTAEDGAGESAGDENPKRLAAMKVSTLRVTAGAAVGTLAGGTDATQAYLDLSGPGSASFDTVVEATALKIGTAGNAGGVTVAAVADGTNNGSNGGASMTQSGVAVTLHYISGVTTVADIERAIAGFGAGALIQVKTHSTHPSYLLLVGDDDFGATNLANGVDMVPAALDMATVGSGTLDTIVEYNLATISSGNGIKVALVADGVATGSLTDNGPDGVFIIHIDPTVTTVTNVETLLAALDGTIHTKTGGTGATAITDTLDAANGAYTVTDSGGTALDAAATVVGIAKLSDDGKTLTFLSPVYGLVITYIPLPVSASELAAPFPSL